MARARVSPAPPALGKALPLMDIEARLGLTYGFIAHDDGVVRCMSERMMVRYLGGMIGISDVAAARAAGTTA